jgi:3'-phosphoadenosine 5'-phosphosulfate sulfotransferase (PAPS reductase)/FAD synthetase
MPTITPEYHILSLSGGKDSTALAFFMKENKPEIFEKLELVFCDTECELPELYDYLNKIEIFLNKKITYIKPPKSFEHLHDMYGYLPHPAKRWCTVELKTKPFQNYLKKRTDNFKVVTNLYIGIRKDEEHRTKTATSKYQNIKEEFPFVEYGINKADIFKILKDVGINLPDFYSWKRRSGCYFCFFQNLNDWLLLYEHYPELYKKAMDYEFKNCKEIKKGNFGWRSDLTLEEMIKPENIKKIKESYAKNNNRKNKEKIDNLVDLL